MGMNTNGHNAAADGFGTAYPYLSIHTGDPGENGANEDANVTRLAANWSAASNGDISATNIQFTDGTPSGPATHVGYWSALTGGTCGGGKALTGDQTFNANGEYTINTLNMQDAVPA